MASRRLPALRPGARLAWRVPAMSPPTSPLTPPCLQATNKLIQAIFKLQTEVTRLKADVDRLGSPTDTAEHRQKIAAANARIKESAKHISEHMKQHSADKQSLQMQKILGNFQVSRDPLPERSLFPCCVIIDMSAPSPAG